jgi:CTP:molybdopterin cytidylyltransferase MocA
VTTGPRGSAAGLVLAAGSGSRLGRPKALLTDAAGATWLARAVSSLVDGGCGSTYVVVGAQAERVRRAAPPGSEIIESARWADGIGASLSTALTELADRSDAETVCVALVDTPGVTASVVRRLLARVGGTRALGRATYGHTLGHPVVIGRDHWAGVVASARGDRGARDYLASHEVTLVECGDIGSGIDIDTPDELDRWLAAEQTRRLGKR